MTRLAITLAAVAMLLLTACNESHTAKSDGNVDLNNPLLREADKIIASEENADVYVTLECPVSDVFLDGTKAPPGKTEKIHIERKTLAQIKPANGATTENWGPITKSDSKIISNGKSFEYIIVKTDGLFAVLSYANRDIDGISSNIMVVNYMIDLTNYKFKRTTGRFPYGTESSFTGQCTVLASENK